MQKLDNWEKEVFLFLKDLDLKNISRFLVSPSILLR